MRNMRGFTLIELLVVMAIIGVLAAIAVSQLAFYRREAFDARAVADLRAAASAEEAYYTTAQAYTSCGDASGCMTVLPGYKKSKGVNLKMSGVDMSFTGTASHDEGTGKTWSYDNMAGGVTN